MFIPLRCNNSAQQSWPQKKTHVKMDSEVVQDVAKTWHRIGSHVRIEWRKQLARIRDRRQTLVEARDSLAFLFGIEGVVWDLDNFKIQVLPCPPRPP